MTQRKIIYIAERVPEGIRSGDCFDIAITWDRDLAVRAAEDDYKRSTSRCKEGCEWILWGRYYDGEETNAERAYDEMLEDVPWLSDDTIAESEKLSFE